MTNLKIEDSCYKGIPYKVTWKPAPFCPKFNVTQVSGICLNQHNEYVLISSNGNDWNIPGGHPELEETNLQTLSREIKEETCAELTSSIYLGAREVLNIGNNEINYQLRYFCIVKSNDFTPNEEVSHLKMVKPECFLTELVYGKTEIAKELFRLSEIHRKFQNHKKNN